MKSIGLILAVLEFASIPFFFYGTMVFTGNKQIWMLVAIPYFFAIGTLNIKNHIKAKHKLPD